MRFAQNLFLPCAAAVLLASASAAQTPARVRGTVTAVSDQVITVKQVDGRIFTLHTSPTSTYAFVVPSSLDAIREHSYIGAAVKGACGHLTAVETVLVPKSMRAGRVGFYPWDPLPDTSGTPVPDPVAKKVAQGRPRVPLELTDTSMTNGTVVASKPGPTGRIFTVVLADGSTATMTMSAGVPVVRFVPSTRPAVSVGSAVVIWTKPPNGVSLVAIGKGVTPPM